MIGTVPISLEDGDDIVWSPTTAFGFDASETAPDPGPHGAYPGGEEYRPGIVLATDAESMPQDIGRIQVAGGVFGDVIIHGSIDLFYAGYLGTNTFDVDGDLNHLVVNTQAGGCEIAEGSAWMSVTDAILDVRGEMASFYCNGDWGLPVRVHGRDDAPSFPGVFDVGTGLYVQTHREIERKFDDDAETVMFPWGALDIDSDTVWIVNNDGPYTAEYVGSVDGTISVIGEMEGDPFDLEDYYSFGLMAGQTVTINLYDTGGWANSVTGNPEFTDSVTSVGDTGGLDLFDPDLNWVADYGEADMVTGALLAVTFTAEKAGIYTVSVNGVIGNVKWLQGNYRLEISGVSPATLGGGNVVGDMRSGAWFGDEIADNVVVTTGNMGALSIGGTGRASQIRVNEGSLAAVRGGANALPPGDTALRYWAEAVLMPDEVPVMGFAFEINEGESLGMADINHVSVGGALGRVSSPLSSFFNVTVAGDLQCLRIGPEVTVDAEADTATGTGDFSGNIVVHGNIGEISVQGAFTDWIADEFGEEWTPSEGAIFANADGIGAPGIIDSIIIGGNFGVHDGEDDAWGGIAFISTGPRGGNVRFIDVGGLVGHQSGGWYRFGGLGPLTFDPGQSVIITDDSGALVTIYPGSGPVSQDDYLYFSPVADDQDTDQDQQQQTTTGGVLTLKLVPVLDVTYEDFIAYGASYYGYDRTELGYAIASIESTDGLRLSSIGGPVEVGVITVAGVTDDTVLITGSNPISVGRVEIVSAGELEADQTADQDQQDTDQATGITRIINATSGDIVSLQIGTGDVNQDQDSTQITVDTSISVGTSVYGIDLISVRGNLGSTYSTTGQVIVSALLEAAADPLSDPGGAQRSGLLVSTSVDLLTVGGELGDVDIRGDVNHIILNDDHSNNPGQFDGVTRPIVIYGNLNYIELGDGIADPGTGYYPESGLFVYGTINNVYITGPGHDIGGPVFATGDIERVQVTDGARIIGYNASVIGGSAERARGTKVYSTHYCVHT